jgi:hypothetical protein
MHVSRSKMPIKNLVKQRCAEGFNSGVTELNKANFAVSTEIHLHSP